ncbi:MAG: DUF1593 domain-containing protein [candidate division KSB1 bacterium]|nr:DUF1593 domain-containing protein [candidate division KSB1 bacterium]
MKTILISMFIFLVPVFQIAAQEIQQKPRIINMTDLGADPDDEQSMVRFLVQSNEYDVEGLIVTTGCWKKSQSNINMLNDLLNAYGEVVSNLQVHDAEFPSLEYLQSISVLGQRGYGMSDVGNGKDSPGSELIISAVDKDDPRPIWICFWGGGNTLAQALWKVQNTRSEDELQKFISKIRVYDVLGQDNAGTWIAKNFPGITYIRATQVYDWQPSDGWLDSHVQNHGPLGAVYPDRKYATEGDTPAFLHLFPNGLNDPDEVWQGGWGGRFGREKQPAVRGMSCMAGEDQVYDPYFMYTNASSSSGIRRWSSGYHNDFAARMDWSVTSQYSEANHHPAAVVNGDTTRNVLNVSALPGSTVGLSAEGSSDPDGHSLSYRWLYYKEAGTYKGRPLTIKNSSTATPIVTIPSDADGQELHIILELHDSGQPGLYAYRRVIINVLDTTRRRVMISTDFPPFPVTNSDPDDVQSMVRFLLYANEFDIEGLIASAGTFDMVAEKKNIQAVLDKYDLVDENLRQYDEQYPTADDLRAVTYEGLGNNHNINIKWGCDEQSWTDIIGQGRDSEASDAIIAAAGKDDPRPIYICVWGGPREIAQAIWKVQNTQSREEFDTFISKLRVYLIACQDATHEWLVSNFPDLFIIESRTTYQGMFGADSREWVETNIINDHGPLCAIYPPSAMGGDGVIEGDTPSFLYLVSANRGINDPKDPTQPSWGGQYVRNDSTNHYIDGPGKSSISMWSDDFQKEFMERADWCLDDTPVNDIEVWLEAECAAVGDNWDILSDARASNEKYVTVKPGVESLEQAPAGSENTIVIPFSVDTSGSFSIYARINCPTYDDDSFWVRVDDESFIMYNSLVTSGWEWMKFDDHMLSPGEHSLTIGYREDGALLDKITISNTGIAPEGMGGEAENLCDPTGVENRSETSECFLLEQNYPNPFNPQTNIQYFLPNHQHVTLDVYNILGHKVATLVNDEKQAGTYTIPFDASELSNGTYFYQLKAGQFVDTRKIMVLK